MKKIVLLSLLLCIICTVKAKERIIERPPFIAFSSTSLEIDKIVVSDTATVLFIKAFYRPNYWIRIAKGTFLKDNNGNTYPISKGIGITLDKEFWMPASGEAEFQLVFPPLPEKVTSISFSEGDFDGSFQIWGIQLDEKNFRKKPLPKDAIVHKVNPKTTLPTPEITYGKSTIKGKIIGYLKGMPKSGQINPSDAVRWLNYVEDFTISEDGTFEIQTNVVTVTPATIILPFTRLSCILAPNKESSIIVNAVECSRLQSRLQKDSKPYGRKAYYEGYLADIQQELADNTINCSLVDNPRQILNDMAGKDVNDAKNYFLDKRQTIFKKIEQSSASKAVKDVLKANTNITTAIGLFMASDMVKRAYMNSQKMSQEEASEYYKNTVIKLPADYYDILKDFSLNTPENLYAEDYAYGIGAFYSQEKIFKEKLNTDKGILFDMMKASKCYRSIEDFTPLTVQQKNELETLSVSAYKDMLLDLNNELLKKIELNKKKTGFAINEVSKDIPDSELFSSIISKFKGHTLLVDLWATWCGPCRMANKTMTPMKEELKDKDIIYIYLTGETSPMGTWQNMIPDIHGEHFRVTNAQWEYLMSTFKVQGVPTYLVIDRDGNKTYQNSGFPGTSVIKEQLLKALNK